MASDFQTDDIVGVLLKGQPLIGRLLSCKGSKAVLAFGGQRRDQEIPLRELVPCGELSDSVRRSVLPTPEQVQSIVLSPRVSAEAWWLLVSDVTDDTLPCISLSDLTDLLVGQPDLIALAAVWSWLNGPQIWFRLRRDRTLQARPLNEIRQQRLKQRREHLQREHDLRQLALLQESAPLTEQRRELLDPTWSDRLDQLLELVHGPEADLGEMPGLGLLQLLGLPPDRKTLKTWLVARELLDPHQPSALRGSAWSSQLPEANAEIIDELLARAADTCSGDDTRVDLTAQRVYTLDDASTQEIDDGLALEPGDGGPWIWIHIADPARLIEPDSPLDREARRRATSLYLADGVLPMLPLKLATEVFSLRAGQRCPALSVGVLLDDEGAVVASRCQRSWVQPRYRLTYEDGDELIELVPPGDEDLAQLSSLLKRRFNWRQRRGAINFERQEGRFRRGANGPELQVIDPSPARVMVSEAMLLMGAVVAEIGRKEGMALPYRSQPPAELPSAQELAEIPEGPARDAAVKRCLSRGLQGTSPMPHFSLGLEAYVQATSPIRRYADLLAHRQLMAWIEQKPLMSEPLLREQLDALEDPLRQSIQISREDQRHWQQVWLEQHRDEQWSVQFLRWLRPQDRLALVHVPDLAMDLVGHADGEDPAPGQLLTMTVLHVDPDRGELKLRFQ